MIKIKIGKGKGSSFSCPFGMPSATLNKIHKDISLTQIAHNLAHQFKIKNGEIHLHSINFTYYKQGEPK